MIPVSGYSILILLRRVLFVWAVEVFGLWMLARFLPGLDVRSVPAAIWAVAVIALLNALVRPILILLTLPFTVLSFGFLILGLNALIMVMAGRIVHGLTVSDLPTAAVTAFGLTAINTLLASAFSLNDEDSVYRNIVRRIARRGTPRDEHIEPGLIVIEIDGLSEPVFKTALRHGYMPTLDRWITRGSHKLTGWDCGLPSQSSSSQAGILCGNNFDIPAFRWYEKENGRLMVSNNPNDASEIERRVSDGNGLLAEQGYSLGNLISGDAPKSLLTMSTMLDPARSVREGYSGFFLYLVNPYHFTRALVLSLWEVAVELWQGARQAVTGVRPRVSRRGSFPFLRAASTVFLRDVNVSLLAAEMFAGAPVAYTTFVGYDVVAHHAGPFRRDALRSLRDIDRKIALLARVAEDAPRPYYFVILSDHGQSTGAPFTQRFGSTLEQLVQSLLTGDETVRAFVGPGEGWGHLNVLLSETAKQQGVAGRTLRRVLHGRTSDGYVHLGQRLRTGMRRRTLRPQKPRRREPSPEAKRPPGIRLGNWRGRDETRDKTAPPGEQAQGNVVVCASGNLGLIYFTDRPGIVFFETIAADYPGLIEGIAGHPGVGFVLARSERYGPLAIGKDGLHYLDDRRVEGKDPLANFGPRAADHVRRLATFPHTGDLVVNSICDPVTGEVAAFEEMIGSHGGLGGPQTQPFLAYPASWEDGEIDATNSTDVYHLLKRWYRQLA